MAPERKISDEDVTRLRDLAGDGWLHQDLAVAFNITPQHVGRLVREEQRPVIAGLDAATVRSGVADAVEAFLVDVTLNAGDGVIAATARALASKLDACSASDSAAAAQAVPRLCGQLVDVLDRLQLGVPREPDFLDRLKQRRQARLAAIATTNGGEFAVDHDLGTPGGYRSFPRVHDASPRQSLARAGIAASEKTRRVA